MSPSVTNQWANSYGQTYTFGNNPPTLGSCVVPLTNTYSVGGGSGTPTAGNWLFTIVSWTQVPSLGNTHVGVGDDIHSWWRQYPASGSGGLVRTSISYTPNTARAVGNIYVAPDGELAAINVLVVEVSGLGPWDTVVGPNTNYAAAATSLALSLSAPGAASFFIGGVGGDNISATQAFAPGGYTTLHTLSQTNGSDHLADNYLTSAYIASSSSSQSVSASAVSAEDLSGFLIGVYVTGTSPIPAGQNPNWPYMKFEAAFGSGYNTPASEMTWTDLSARLWSWDETTGIQFQLGAMQATNLNLELDNNDNYLASQNTSSPYYPNVVAGTPLRLRGALGTMGGTTYNRWYVIQRNAQEWQEAIDGAHRRTSPSTGTDLWATLSSASHTPYRGEVYVDSPYAWWPCDDVEKLAGGQPTSLLNVAVGNSNTLGITSNTLALTTLYMTNGSVEPGATNTDLSDYAVNADPAWMYGDPAVSPASIGGSGQITASPGANAWQALDQTGNTGSNGYFLVCNDASFPPLSGGVTIEGWFFYSFFANNVYQGTNTPVCGGPYSAYSLFTLTTNSNPVAILQLDLSGNLNLITYNGSTPTSHSVYSTTDLRDANWRHFAVTLTQTTWAVFINGGLRAHASGTATGMTSAWTYLVVNGDMGSTHGGGATSSITHGANVEVSHVAVYPGQLPAWRLLSHYNAATTGFGVIPIPASATASSDNISVTSGGLTLDGQYNTAGTYASGSPSTLFYYPVQAIAIMGAHHSAPAPYTLGIAAGISGSPSGQMTVACDGVSDEFAFYTLNNSFSSFALTQASVSCAGYDIYTSGFGASTVSIALAHIAAGSGAAVPAGPTALGDTVGQRIERLLGYGNATSPARCIDPAPLQLQAALDIGGQQAGNNIQNIVLSDGGMLFIDNLGNLNYWQRTHLASQYSSPVWTIGPTSPHIPYYPEIRWLADPHRIWNNIDVQPYSPSGVSLPISTPSNGAGVVTSQQRYGAQPYQINSYLQSTSEMQNQADWLFSNFGQPQRRAEKVRIDAAAYPLAWGLVLGVNVGDVVTIEDWQIGGGGAVNTFRVTEIERKLFFGNSNDETSVAEVILTCDYEPSSYWS